MLNCSSYVFFKNFVLIWITFNRNVKNWCHSPYVLYKILCQNSREYGVSESSSILFIFLCDSDCKFGKKKRKGYMLLC